MLPPPLAPGPSRLARRTLLVLHLIATGVAALLPPFWGVVAGVWVAFSAFWTWRTCRRVISLQILGDGRIVLIGADGLRHEADLLPSSRVMAWLVVLHLLHSGGRTQLVLWPDSAPADVLRQWRVWLRWQWPAFQIK